MSIVYIGFRAELPSRRVKSDLEDILKQYNSAGDSRILDFRIDGKITVERKDSMLIARGTDDPINKKQGMTNFALVVPSESKTEAERVVQIINVLGNDRLIRERVKTFIDGESALNDLPELHGMIKAFKDLDHYIRGFVIAGWYYAPEVIFNDNGNK